MFQRVLVANRGEIARRVMRSCRDLGISTVAVYSDPDRHSAFVTDADQSVALGGSTPAESYLVVDAILAAAERSGAEAIHPGYGFLSENAEFAQAVIDAGLVFVGPRPEVIASMGSKLKAKALMAEAGVPMLGSVELTGLSGDEASARVGDIGYPALIKASAGGGGRGMRIVTDPADLADAVASAAREATSAFGDGTIYAERYVAASRHVEVQIFGDDSGRVVHFHERECSIQRRHQKIIEEAPSPSLDSQTRSRLHEAAVRAGAAIGYTNAGTVEFLLGSGGPGQASEFFFLEVNTRLQVEHPVTEAVLGVDLVALQLEVAAGGSVPDQADIGPVSGHAIEARLYAEDSTANFAPSIGSIHAFHVPGSVRVDSAIDSTVEGRGPEPGRPAAEVSQFYDPMLAKVIAHGDSREVAARRLASALEGTVVDGIITNRDLLVRTFRHPDFLSGNADSRFLERHDPAVLGAPLVAGAASYPYAAAAALSLQAQNRSADAHTPAVATGFRNVATAPQQVQLRPSATSGAGSGDAPGLDGVLVVEYRFDGSRLTSLAVDGNQLADPEVILATPTSVDLSVDGLRRQFVVRIGDTSVSVTGPEGVVSFARVPRFAEQVAEDVVGSTVASMPGTVVAVSVEPGDVVAVGDLLVTMEAMKMEITITASQAGTVSQVPVAPGDNVAAGTVLAVVDPVAS